MIEQSRVAEAQRGGEHAGETAGKAVMGSGGEAAAQQRDGRAAHNAHVHTCTHTHTPAHTLAHTHTRTHTHVRTRAHTSTHAHAHMHTQYCLSFWQGLYIKRIGARMRATHLDAQDQGATTLAGHHLPRVVLGLEQQRVCALQLLQHLHHQLRTTQPHGTAAVGTRLHALMSAAAVHAPPPIPAHNTATWSSSRGIARCARACASLRTMVRCGARTLAACFRL